MKKKNKRITLKRLLNETNNERRVRYARETILASPYYGKYPEPLEVIITDILTDLAHFCKAEGVDFEQRLESANEHFKAEVECKDDGEEG